MFCYMYLRVADIFLLIQVRPSLLLVQTEKRM